MARGRKKKSKFKDNPSAEELEIVKQHQLRLKNLQTRRSQFDTIMEDVADYIVPYREDWDNQQKTQGEEHGQKIFDGTAVNAASIFTHGMFGNIVSNAFPWFRFGLSVPEIEKMPEVKAYLQTVERRTLRALAASNFYREMLPFIRDWGTIGTATLYSEMDFTTKRLMFSCIHPRQIYIAVNRFGIVDTVYREFELSLRAMVDMFGEDGISASYKSIIKDDPDFIINMLHCVFPRQDFDHSRFDAQNKPIASIWIDQDNGRLLRESGFDAFPYVVGRYEVNSGEDYGRTPVMEAMPDIKALNRLSKDLLGASDRHVNPPVMVPESLLHTLDMGTAGVNVYAHSDDRIFPIGAEGNYPVGVDREERKQRMIREAMHVDFFLALLTSERQMTATEILERQGEKAVVLAPVTARFSFEVLDNAINRSFNLLTEAGMLPPPPPILTQLETDINITYLGPLSEIQARLFENRGITETMARVAPMAEFFPDIMDNFDGDEIAQGIAESRNMPHKTIRDPKEVEARREQRAQAQAAAAQAAQAESAARTLKDMGAANQNLGGILQDAGEEMVNERTA
jgi:hypothetical protein